MLYLSTKLRDIGLFSIRSSGRIGTVLSPIINPHNLHIDGFWCQAVHSKDKLVLLDIHVRELAPRGIIIDDHHNLSEPDELVRLKPIIDLDFQIEDKMVISGKKKIGKVSEYAIDRESLFVQKLYVQPPIWQSINQNRLTIGRNCILEVTDTHILISEPTEKVETESKVSIPKFSVKMAQQPSANFSDT